MSGEFWEDFWSQLALIPLILQVAIIAGLAASYFFLEKLKSMALDWLKSRKLHPLARSIRANQAVHALLVEVRVKTEADRSNVFLFHNGQVFSNYNPVWRLSCTQETCKPGITHDMVKLQGLLSSTMWEGLAPLFESPFTGVEALECSNKNKVYVFHVEDMADGFHKQFLISRGIKVKVVCPLIDSKKQIVGFVSLNYCRNFTVKKAVIDEISEATAKINFSLMETN